MTTCRHCQARPANRRRGLCSTCYYKPAVRALYSSTSKFGRRGLKDFCGGYQLPAPCAAPPGPAKVPTLEERAAAGLALWSPKDPRA
jgi:hypothetical protein